MDVDEAIAVAVTNARLAGYDIDPDWVQAVRHAIITDTVDELIAARIRAIKETPAGATSKPDPLDQARRPGPDPR